MADKPSHDSTDVTEDVQQAMGVEKTDVLPAGQATVIGGKYRLGRLIGEGGMGAVYEAEHTGLGVQVAVKLLNESFTTDHKAVSRFRREARAAAAIRHPNIVEVTDTGTDEDGVPFIVMELLVGESLSALLRREKVLAPQTAVIIASQMLAGLGAAHTKGVVHRDLKPGNIVLARLEDGSHQVKVLDFGISKFFSDSVPQDVTAAGAVIGTPRFMAPEQAIGQPDLDARVDLYAVGVLLYRMTTGRVPFNAKTPEGIIQAILEGTPTPPRQLRPELPETLEQVISKAMTGNRELRFQDAGQFIQALKEAVPEALGGPLQITIHPSLSSESPTPGGHGPPTDSISVGMPTASAMFPLPQHTGPFAPGGQPTLVKEAPPAPRRAPWILPLILLLALGGSAGWYFWARSVQPVASGTADAGAPEVAYPGRPVHMGITRYLPKKQLISEHATLMRYLSSSMKRRVELVVHEDYVDLSGELASGKLDFAALSSYNYVRAKRRWPGLRLLATHVTSGGSSYEGFVVARSDSGVRTLEDLKGRIFCYVNPTSTSGYLYPRALFRRHNMDPDKVFSATRFTGDHLLAIRALEKGACDGAAVFTGIFFEAKKHGFSPERFTVLATTDRIPYDAYCASPGSDPELVDSFLGALLALKPDSALARQVLVSKQRKSRIVGFIQGKDADYDPVRKIEKYIDTPKEPEKTK